MGAGMGAGSAASDAAAVAAAAPGGLVVAVGADAALLSDLATGGRHVVHAWAADAAARDAQRIALAGQRRYGSVSVQAWVPGELPYMDALANVVVVDRDALGAAAPAPTEIQRVLAPRGTAFVRERGAWTRTVKPVPAGLGEWTHRTPTPDGNALAPDRLVKPTTNLQWVGGPQFLPTSHAAIRVAKGRVFMETARVGANQVAVQARDASSGVLLWSIDTDYGEGINRAMVTDGDRLFSFTRRNGPVVALNAADGSVMTTYSEGIANPFRDEFNNTPMEYQVKGTPQIRMAVMDGVLVQGMAQELVGLEVASGRRLWRAAMTAPSRFGFLSVSEGVVYVAELKDAILFGRNPWGALLGVHAYDLKTGAVRWSWKADPGLRATHILISEKHRSVILHNAHHLGQNPSDRENPERDINVICLSTADGKQRWRWQVPKDGLWVLQVPVVRDDDLHLVNGENYVRLDVRDGKMQESKQIQGWACAQPAITPDWIISGMQVWIDRQWTFRKDYSIRGGCAAGVYPANGLLYGLPQGCICNAFIRGHVATNSNPLVEPIAIAQRTEKGPAFAPIPRPSAWPAKGTWPALRADAMRSNGTDTAIATTLRIAWTATAPAAAAGLVERDRLMTDDETTSKQRSAPSVAEGVAVVAHPNEHAIVAFDAATGAQRWRFVAGGRIDNQPVLYGGQALFGSRDGYVYAVRLSDGALTWRFLAARGRRHVVAHSQVESAWPVPAPVVVHGHAVFAIAGRAEGVGGGFTVWRIDLATGQGTASHAIVDDTQPVKTWPKYLEKGQTSHPGHRRTMQSYVPLDFDGTAIRTGGGHALDAATLKPMPFGQGGPYISELRGTATDKNYMIRRSFGGAFFYVNSAYDGDGGATFNPVRNGRIRGQQFASGDLLAALGSTVIAYSFRPRDRAHGDGSLYQWEVDAKGVFSAPKHLGNVPNPHTDYVAGIIAGQHLILADNNRRRDQEPKAQLLLIARSDPKQVTRIPLPDRVETRGLAAADGRVYVLLEDGRLLCLAP